jgi:hypothetical protein
MSANDLNIFDVIPQADSDETASECTGGTRS